MNIKIAAKSLFIILTLIFVCSCSIFEGGGSSPSDDNNVITPEPVIPQNPFGEGGDTEQIPEEKPPPEKKPDPTPPKVENVVIYTTSLDPCFQSEQCDRKINGSKGSEKYTWTLDSTTPLPDGLSFQSENNIGKITGKTDKTGEFSIKVTMTDQSDATNFATQEFILKIKPHVAEGIKIKVSNSTGSDGAWSKVIDFNSVTIDSTMRQALKLEVVSADTPQKTLTSKKYFWSITEGTTDNFKNKLAIFAPPAEDSSTDQRTTAYIMPWYADGKHDAYEALVAALEENGKTGIENITISVVDEFGTKAEDVTLRLVQPEMGLNQKCRLHNDLNLTVDSSIKEIQNTMTNAPNGGGTANIEAKATGGIGEYKWSYEHDMTTSQWKYEVEKQTCEKNNYKLKITDIRPKSYNNTSDPESTITVKVTDDCGRTVTQPVTLKYKYPGEFNSADLHVKWLMDSFGNLDDQMSDRAGAWLTFMFAHNAVPCKVKDTDGKEIDAYCGGDGKYYGHFNFDLGTICGACNGAWIWDDPGIPYPTVQRHFWPESGDKADNIKDINVIAINLRGVDDDWTQVVAKNMEIYTTYWRAGIGDIILEAGGDDCDHRTTADNRVVSGGDCGQDRIYRVAYGDPTKEGDVYKNDTWHRRDLLDIYPNLYYRVEP